MTFNLYSGDGVTTQFDLSFAYTDEATIHVTVDGVAVEFTFINPSRVELTTAPASGTTVKIARITPVDTPVVDFEDGAIVRAEDLDLAVGQVLNRAEELGSEIDDTSSRALKVAFGETGLPVGAIAEGEVLARIGDALQGIVNDPATATDAAETATDAAASAEFDADRADAALTSIQALQTGLYDDTAAGLAATVDGETFSVNNTVDTTIDIYRNELGAATLLHTLPTNALVQAVSDAVQVSSGTSSVALADSTGTPLFSVDAQGRWLDAEGNAPLEVLAAAAVSGAPAGLASAVTTAAKLIADKQHHAPLTPRKFSVLLWDGVNAARGTQAVRMPGAPEFLNQTTTLFGTERSGPSGAEEGLGLARRDITIDFVNQSATLGPISTVERGTNFDSGIGQVVAPVPFRIQQGERAGIVDLIYSAIDPEDLTYTTPGSVFDLYLRTSEDDYATATKLIDGDSIYAGLGLTPPDTMAGLNMAAGSTQVEVPAGYPNAGRRIIAVYVFGTEGAKIGTIYAEKDTNTWQLGEFFDFTSLGLPIGNDVNAWNEPSLMWTPEGFHIYVRNERADGVEPTTYYNLTHRGRFYAFSSTGISGWTNHEWLQEPNIGNTPAQALYVPDGSERIFLGGSTSLAAGERREYKLFMAYGEPTNFVAAAEPLLSSDLAGYGPLHWVLGNDGQMWLVLIQEHGDGYLGFNGNSNLYATCMNMAWVVENMETI